MKKLTLFLAAALTLAVLCACGSKEESAAVMTKAQLQATLEGSWINQSSPDETLAVGAGLTVEKNEGGVSSGGTISLSESTGKLTVSFGGDSASVYQWVDSLSSLSDNTWYVDGGTFAIGNTIYIRNG